RASMSSAEEISGAGREALARPALASLASSPTAAIGTSSPSSRARRGPKNARSTVASTRPARKPTSRPVEALCRGGSPPRVTRAGADATADAAGRFVRGIDGPGLRRGEGAASRNAGLPSRQDGNLHQAFGLGPVEQDVHHLDRLPRSALDKIVL